MIENYILRLLTHYVKGFLLKEVVSAAFFAHFLVIFLSLTVALFNWKGTCRKRMLQMDCQTINKDEFVADLFLDKEGKF